MHLNLLFILPSTFLIFISLVFYFALKNDDKKQLSLKRKPTISIIIPVLNEVNTVEGTINSLLEARKYYPNLKEIIVVDDGSDDGTYELLLKLKRKIKILKVFRNVVRSKGINVNYGAKRATGEIIGVIDADSFVEPRIFLKMLPYFEDKNVGSVIATAVPKNTRNFIERYQEIEYIFVSFVRKALSALDAMYITPGGTMPLYKRELFNKIGGYCGPEILTEDMEIGLRLIKAGYKIKVARDAKVYTRVPSTFYRFFRQRIRWYRGTIQTFKKHPDMVFSFKYGVVSALVLPLFYILIVATLLIYISIGIGLYDKMSMAFLKLKTAIILGYFPKLFAFDFETNLLFVFSYMTFFVFLNFLIWFLAFREGVKISGKKWNKKIIMGILISALYGPIAFSAYFFAFYEEFMGKPNRWW